MLFLFILVWGMVAGAVAQLIVRSGQRIDWQLALITGLIGSFVGGLIGSLLAGDGIALRPSGVIGSIVGAIVLLLGIELWDRSKARE